MQTHSFPLGVSLGVPQIHSLAAETPHIVQMDVYSHVQARLMGASRAWEFTFHGFLSPQTCFLVWIFFPSRKQLSAY